MTEPTYYARIGNEAEREMTMLLTARHVSDDYQWEVIHFESGQLCANWLENMSDNKTEIPFPEFIRRFVPLSVIGALAECHGMRIMSFEDMDSIVSTLENISQRKYDDK